MVEREVREPETTNVTGTPNVPRAPNTGATNVGAPTGGEGHRGTLQEAKNAFQRGNPQDVREEVRLLVEKSVAAVAGAVQGFVDTMRREDVAGKTREAIKQTGDTTRQVASTVAEEGRKVMQQGRKVTETVGKEGQKLMQEGRETTHRLRESGTQMAEEGAKTAEETAEIASGAAHGAREAAERQNKS